MGGEIVKLIEHFGGQVADSYQLALMANAHPEKDVIVESAVHFMAEAIAILANPNQRVYITNPKAGCTMEMNAKDDMVEPALEALNDRYSLDRILPVSYMNTSGRIKALTGAQGGAVCTSSNVQKIFEWALAQGRKILFIPDKHMGENVAKWVGIPPEKIAHWPGGWEGANYNLAAQDENTKRGFDEASLVLFGSECGVHTVFKPEQVEWFRAQGYHIAVHPECRKVVVDVADSHGSTAYLWDLVMNNRAGTGMYAIGTEGHMVFNLREAARAKGIIVANLHEALVPGLQQMGCGCATMSRNDPPHLVAILDLLRQGKAPDINEVKPGDVVDESTASRDRLNSKGQVWVVQNARRALEKMIEITESN
jgi:quinolinate synthase